MSLSISRETRVKTPNLRHFSDEGEKKSRVEKIRKRGFSKPALSHKKLKISKPVEFLVLPKNIGFEFRDKDQNLSSKVERKFAAAWEKAKKQFKSALPKDFQRACKKFFAKQTANPYGVTVDRALNPRMGKGAFIQADVDAGEVIGFYPPIVVEESDAADNPYIFSIAGVPQMSRFVLDGGGVDPAINFTPFINDIKGFANVKFQECYTEQGPLIVVSALVPFKKEERAELSVEYGPSYWENLSEKSQLGPVPLRAPDPMEVEEKAPPLSKPKSSRAIPQQEKIDRKPTFNFTAAEFEALQLTHPFKPDPKIRFRSKELVQFLYPKNTKALTLARDSQGQLQIKKIIRKGQSPKIVAVWRDRILSGVSEEGVIKLDHRRETVTFTHLYDTRLSGLSEGGLLVLGQLFPGTNQYALVKLSKGPNGVIQGKMIDFKNSLFKIERERGRFFFEVLPLFGIDNSDQAREKLKTVGLHPKEVVWNSGVEIIPGLIYEPFHFVDENGSLLSAAPRNA